MSIRDEILQKIGEMNADLIILHDPDNLLLEEELLKELENRMLRTINYRDPIELYYHFEVEHRIPRDENVTPEYRLLIRLEDCDCKALPYAIVKEGEYATLSLFYFFPKLDTQVVKELTASQREILYRVYRGYSGQTLGSNVTKEYIIKNVFKIDPTMLNTVPELFHYLIKRHYTQEIYPSVLDMYMIDIFSRNKEFNDIPVKDLITNRTEFFKYMQDEWVKYIASFSEATASTIVPFEHNDIRVYVDNLFVEGLMKPIEVTGADSVRGWAQVGVLVDGNLRNKERTLRLFENIKGEAPQRQCSSSEWFKFAERWAEFLKTLYSLDEKLDSDNVSFVEDFHTRLEEQFETWMLEKYSSIFSLSYLPQPKTVFHVLPYLLSRQRKGIKTALVVLDGMAYDQWSVISELFREHYDIEIQVSPLFAWVPTVTSISRQSIFSGKMPSGFSDSLYHTGKEEKQWINYWQNTGIQKSQIGFFPNLKLKDKNLEFLKDVINYTVIGSTITTIDTMVHGSELDPGALYNNIVHWIKNGGFIEFIELLLASGFLICLTSDHGNIYSTGIGKPDEGVLPETKGERVRIFNNEHLLDIVRGKEGGIKWNNFGLPSSCHALLAQGRTSYIQEGEKSITHGGSSLEEVIVPFVELRRKS